ncbi:hypothetical protein [Flavobacterium piscinae]|uniref:hypothetical protein n=1 Tax=Flavobacterium piscinae TaxID=2506424 RepID=UPI002AAC240C|nr:hypothetical protein [Flavobacterium piscinae]
MKKIIVSFIVALGLISCSNAQKTEFSKEALADKMMSVDGTELTFSDILKNMKEKLLLLMFGPLGVRIASKECQK